MLTINFIDIFLMYSKGLVYDNIVFNNIIVTMKINDIHFIQKTGFFNYIIKYSDN